MCGLGVDYGCNIHALFNNKQVCKGTVDLHMMKNERTREILVNL